MLHNRVGALGALAGLLLMAVAGGAAADGPTSGAVQPDPVGVALSAADASGTDPFTILGASRLDAEGLVAAFGASGHRPRLTVPIDELARIFVEEGAAYGVRADLAWAQSLVETGWFWYPDHGQVRLTDNNYAGIGAYDGGVHGFHYPDARTGVRAQMQLLRQYADAEPVDEALGALVVHAPASKLGAVASWREMGNGNWATSTRYSHTVLSVYLGMLESTGTSLDEPVAAPPPDPAAALRPGDGLWLVGADAQVYDVGDTRFWGSAADRPRNGPVVAVVPTRSGKGYWVVTRDGDVFSFGDARRVSIPRARSAAPIATASPAGRGLWLVGAGGGVVALGGAAPIAPAPGSVAPGARLVAIAPTPSGLGYWLVDTAGRVVPAGDAVDLGDVVRGPTLAGVAASEDAAAAKGQDAPGGAPVDGRADEAPAAPPGSPEDPVVGIAAQSGSGYWLLSASGAVVPFGAAEDFGSLPDALDEAGEAKVAVALAATQTGLGYWIVTGDGTVAGLGDAANLGAVTGDGAPIVAAAASRSS